jgi:thiamine-phosphate pyrophosphorylase
MIQLPPIYPITDGRRREPLAEQVRRLGAAGFPLVQFRGKPQDPLCQWAELRTALREAADRGGWPAICLNDRADLAVLAAREAPGLWGLHLGQDDLPPAEARRLPDLAGLHLGTSTHQLSEWTGTEACDHAGVGPLRATASKGDHAAPLGLEGLAEGCRILRARGIAPVAIGGLGVRDARDCFQAGAEALAMIGAVARARDPRLLLWRAQLERWRARPPIARGQGIVLVGGSGAGKSTLARQLARMLDMPDRDADQRVEAEAGMSIAQLFQQRGEAGFRALEAQAVKDCVTSPGVVALGAGAWENPDTRAAVRASGSAVLWLAEVPERAWARVGGDPFRPLASTREQFLARWRQRTAAWSEAPMVLPLGRSSSTLARALVRAMSHAEAQARSIV